LPTGRFPASAAVLGAFLPFFILRRLFQRLKALQQNPGGYNNVPREKTMFKARSTMFHGIKQCCSTPKPCSRRSNNIRGQPDFVLRRQTMLYEKKQWEKPGKVKTGPASAKK
jgi:hypothetical protein